jgi:hypothetical protein
MAESSDGPAGALGVSSVEFNENLILMSATMSEMTMSEIMTTPTSGGSGDGVRSGPGSRGREPTAILQGPRFQEFDVGHISRR